MTSVMSVILYLLLQTYFLPLLRLKQGQGQAVECRCKITDVTDCTDGNHLPNQHTRSRPGTQTRHKARTKPIAFYLLG